MTKDLGNIWARPAEDPEFEAAQELRKFWGKKIFPRDNWKNPIDTWIDLDEFTNCNSAAIYFCGSPLEIVDQEGPLAHVKGAGYYNMIGA